MRSVNNLFNNLYEGPFFGGSYYDKLSVGKPEDYDIDLKLVLPKLLKPEIKISNEPGFVKIILGGWQDLEKQRAEYEKYKDLKDCVDKNNYLLTDKILSWMEKIVARAFNKYNYDSGINVVHYVLQYMGNDLEVGVIPLI